MEFSEELKKIVELQQTDSGLDELERIQKGFRQDITHLEEDVTALQNRLQEEKKGLENVVKQRRNLEIEASAFQNKIDKYLGQQNEVKSNEQFTALKQEIDKSKEEKARAEEKVLEFLFKEDEQKAKIQKMVQQLSLAEKKAANEKKGIEDKIADCEKTALEKKEERQKQLAELPSDFAEGYEKLRNNGKKIVVAEVLEDQTCAGCHMKIPPQIINEMRKNLIIQRCNCGRYIYIKDL